MLYCMNPAEEGGINKFLDHELLYIYFNKESERIKELMDKSAYCIPKMRPLEEQKNMVIYST